MRSMAQWMDGETEEAHHSSIDPPEGVDSPGCDGLIAGPLADTTA